MNLFQFCAVFESVSDLLAQADVGGCRRVKDNGVQFFLVHVAVRQNTLVGADIDDLTDHVAVLVAFEEFTF